MCGIIESAGRKAEKVKKGRRDETIEDAYACSASHPEELISRERSIVGGEGNRLIDQIMALNLFHGIADRLFEHHNCANERMGFS